MRVGAAGTKHAGSFAEGCAIREGSAGWSTIHGVKATSFSRLAHVLLPAAQSVSTAAAAGGLVQTRVRAFVFGQRHSRGAVEGERGDVHILRVERRRLGGLTPARLQYRTPNWLRRASGSPARERAHACQLTHEPCWCAADLTSLPPVSLPKILTHPGLNGSNTRRPPMTPSGSRPTAGRVPDANERANRWRHPLPVCGVVPHKTVKLRDNEGPGQLVVQDATLGVEERDHLVAEGGG